MSIYGLVGRFQASGAQGVHDQLVLAEHITGSIRSAGDGFDADSQLLLPERGVEVGKDGISAGLNHERMELGIQLNEARRILLGFPLLVYDALEGVNLAFGHGVQS